jgi:hypothetical protein
MISIRKIITSKQTFCGFCLVFSENVYHVYTEICGYSHDFCEKVEHAFYRNSINKITYQFSTNDQISFIQMLRYDAILPHVLNSV